MAPLRSLGNPVSKFDDFYSETGFEVQNRLYVDDVFSTYLYDGTGTAQTITNGIDLSGEGGMVWTKCRSLDEAHMVFDTERGVWNRVFTNTTTAESTSSNTLTAFNSDGFTIGDNNIFNTNGSSNCSWTFRKAPGFFDVVTYTGNGTAGREIPHSLGSTPGMVIVKRLNGADNWTVQHRSLGGTKSLYLNLTNAQDTSSTEWNNTAATASVFTVGTSGKTNANGDTYVAYLFAHDDQSFGENGDESVIKCGSYTGTTSGVDLNLGFEPQWVMIKRTSGSATNYTNWVILDNMRGVVAGGTDTPLAANLTTAENGTYLYGTGNPANLIEFNATGIRVDPGGNQFTSVCTDGETYIYIAIRRPHKPITDPTKLFAVGSNTKSEPEYISDFVVDMSLHRNVGTNLTDDTVIFSRLTGSKALTTNSTAIESTPNAIDQFDFMNGWGDNQANDNNYKSWMFRCAPGFFDVVTYSGQAPNAQSIPHNLGVVPELILIKCRTALTSWAVYSSTLGEAKYLMLDDNANATSSTTAWNNTSPTSTTFTVGDLANTNQNNQDFIAHLFATLPGISKVGSYSGTGNNVDVDCGFTAGARFVLIKRTDVSNTGNWYVWDYVRGISSGNDPYILLNSNAAEITNTDYIDPLNSGFTVTSSAPADLNDSSGTYLFLAIA